MKEKVQFESTIANIYIFANNEKHPVQMDVSVCNKPVWIWYP